MTSVRVQVFADKIKECAKVGIVDAFGVGLVPGGDVIQKPQDIIGSISKSPNSRQNRSMIGR